RRRRLADGAAKFGPAFADTAKNYGFRPAFTPSMLYSTIVLLPLAPVLSAPLPYSTQIEPPPIVMLSGALLPVGACARMCWPMTFAMSRLSPLFGLCRGRRMPTTHCGLAALDTTPWSPKINSRSTHHVRTSRNNGH